jgi:hypothetical protein
MALGEAVAEMLQGCNKSCGDVTKLQGCYKNVEQNAGGERPQKALWRGY